MRYKYIKWVIISLIIGLSLRQIYQYHYVQINRAQWREVTAYADKYVNPDDLLLFLDRRSEYVFNYYSKNIYPVARGFFKENIDFSKYNRVWFFKVKPHIIIEDKLRQSFELMYHGIYSGVSEDSILEIYLLGRKDILAKPLAVNLNVL